MSSSARKERKEAIIYLPFEYPQEKKGKERKRDPSLINIEKGSPLSPYPFFLVYLENFHATCNILIAHNERFNGFFDRQLF